MAGSAPSIPLWRNPHPTRPSKKRKHPKTKRRRKTLSKSERLDFIIGHKLITRLLPDYVQQLTETREAIAELEQQKESFERGELIEFTENGADEDTLLIDEEADEENGENGKRNYVIVLEDRLDTLKAEISKPLQRIQELQKTLKPTSKGKNGTQVQQSLFSETPASQDELTDLETEIAPQLQEIEAIERKLAYYDAIKVSLSRTRKQQQELLNALLHHLDTRQQQLTSQECQQHILEITHNDIIAQLERYIIAHRQQVIAAIENWWDKYHVTLQEIETKRDQAARELAQYLKGLGYA